MYDELIYRLARDGHANGWHASICREAIGAIETLQGQLAQVKAERDEFKLTLYLATRVKVMEVGQQLGKSQDEIDSMALETMVATLEMVDVKQAGELFERAARNVKVSGAN